MKKIKLFEEFNSSESLNEAFEVHYSDGVRAMKKFGSEKQAIDFAKDLIKNKKSLQFVDVFKAGSGFHSTADTDAIVAFWGDGSYTDNVSKKDPKLAAKKIEESLVLSNVTEGVVSIKGGRIIAHKVLNKLVDMGLIPVKKKSEDLLETIAEVIASAKMESVEVNEGQTLISDEIGNNIAILQDQVDAMLKWDITDQKWIVALKGIQSALNKVDDLVAKADQKLGAIPYNESILNEGAVKQFEMDYADMEKSIKRGIGWIDPEYVEETWNNTSDSFPFNLVASEIYERLIKAGLLCYADESGEEKGKQVKSLKELGIKESVINEAFDVKVSLKHTKDAIALFNDMFMKYGKRPSTDVFSFKEKDAAIDFVQMLIKNLQIPMGEIEADEKIIKNLK